MNRAASIAQYVQPVVDRLSHFTVIIRCTQQTVLYRLNSAVSLNMNSWLEAQLAETGICFSF